MNDVKQILLLICIYFISFSLQVEEEYDIPPPNDKHTTSSCYKCFTSISSYTFNFINDLVGLTKIKSLINDFFNMDKSKLMVFTLVISLVILLFSRYLGNDEDTIISYSPINNNSNNHNNSSLDQTEDNNKIDWDYLDNSN